MSADKKLQQRVAVSLFYGDPKLWRFPSAKDAKLRFMQGVEVCVECSYEYFSKMEQQWKEGVSIRIIMDKYDSPCPEHFKEFREVKNKRWVWFHAGRMDTQRVSFSLDEMMEKVMR